MASLFALIIAALLTFQSVNGLGLQLRSNPTITRTLSQSHTRALSIPTVPATPIYAKTRVSGCAVEGSPGANTTSKLYGSQKVSNVLGCQSQCNSTRGCVMYAWSSSVLVGEQCMLYTAVSTEDYLRVDYTSAVIRGNTGIFFSDKYPSDRSSFCYSGAPTSLYHESIDNSTTIVDPSTTNPSTTPTTSDPAIATKTSLTSCNFRGLPGPIVDYTIISHYSSSPLVCQGSCQFLDGCLSYSYRAVTASNTAYPNCEMYSTKFDTQVNGTDLVILSPISEIYYSDRWPGDGSDYCYGDGTQIPATGPGGPMSTTTGA